jgi:hypothetical protein
MTDTRQRTNLAVFYGPIDYRVCFHSISKPKGSAGYLIYPADVRDTAKSGMGCSDNHHLNYLVESISVNMGGSQRNVKASSLPMAVESVGGVIVLGAQESCAQGEGRQSVGRSSVQYPNDNMEESYP